MTDHTNEDVAVVRDWALEVLEPTRRAQVAALCDRLERVMADRDEARADASRLARVLAKTISTVEGYTGPEVWWAKEAREALAAHTSHLTLTGPEHKPIGTFYTVEDAVEDAKGSSAGSHKQHGQRANSSDKARPADDDVGPPAPGEGDDLPNPEMEVEC